MPAIPIRRAVQQLREASWLDRLKCAYLAFIASAFVGLAVSPQVRRELVKPASLIVIMLLVAAKDLAPHA